MDKDERGRGAGWIALAAIVAGLILLGACMGMIGSMGG